MAGFGLGKRHDDVGRHRGCGWSVTSGATLEFASAIATASSSQTIKFSTIVPIGLDSLWSPNGRQLLYSVYRSEDDYRPRLWMVDAQGEEIGKNRRDLGLITWARKCTFSSQSGVIYCGVPKNLQEGAGILPHLVESRDTLYRIDLNRGAREEIALPVKADRSDAFDIEQLFCRRMKTSCSLQNALDGKIYKVQL